MDNYYCMNGTNGILFYSRNCKHSNDLVKVMQNKKLLHMFTNKCVDDMTEAEIVRSGLNEVPALLIISNQGGSQKRDIYEGKAAFDWVYRLADHRNEIMSQQIAMAQRNKRIIEMAANKDKLKNRLYEYSQNESEGTSDGYSFWNDDITKELDIAQPKTFLPYKQDAQYSILTVPEDPREKHNKLTKKDQEKMLTDLETSRRIQDDQLKNIYEQQQFQTIVQSNKQ